MSALHGAPYCMHEYRARNAPAVLVADHRPILPRDVLVGAQVAQCVVRIVVVMPVLVALVPAPALEAMRCTIHAMHTAHAHTMHTPRKHAHAMHTRCTLRAHAVHIPSYMPCHTSVMSVSKKRVRCRACGKHAPQFMHQPRTIYAPFMLMP